MLKVGNEFGVTFQVFVFLVSNICQFLNQALCFSSRLFSKFG